MPPRTVATAIINEAPEVYEDKNVHAIYDEIASHFSSTRYKPWPIIAKFLSNLPTGWVGLDAGTGNGKYLSLPSDRSGDIWTIGLDRSRNLLEIAQTAGGIIREVVLGNILDISWRKGVFDYAISIATIHHLATYDRRRKAIQRLLESVSPSHGRILIYVWAIEQDELSKRAIPTDTSHSNTGIDVTVPWVLSQQLAKKNSKEVSVGGQVYHRYYHMFSKEELPALVFEAARELGLRVGREAEESGSFSGVELIQDGWERSNYYVELRRWDKR